MGNLDRFMLECTVCETPVSVGCDCWTKCQKPGCQWSYPKGKFCRNPEHSTPDLSAIVRGLTKAQRWHVLHGRQPEGMGKWPVRNALVDKGLATTFPWGWTPLGMQVRALLTQSTETNDA